jgi:hypothetical protein
MGLESANYLLVPDAGIAVARDAIESFGASTREPFPASNFERWVIRGDRYWIDVMTGQFGSDARAAISLRIALSNPLEADDVLGRLLKNLMARMPGILFDKQTGRSYRHFDENNWRELHAALNQKRAEFQRDFGPFEAAISGEDVFPTLRGLKNAT